jgi:nicotinate-nucleotide adenylyltransferase
VKIGILGGTFDPVHAAHLHLARRVRQVFSLDAVWFMVAHLPPHKEKHAVSSGFHRYAMAVLAVQEEKEIYASSWELERSHTSFTVDTLDTLRNESPEDDFCFIAGSDSLLDIHSWKDCGRLLLEHCFIFVQRPGLEVDLERIPLSGRLKEVIQPVFPDSDKSIQAGRSFLISLDAPPVSSTSIRRAIAAGQLPNADCLPASVLSYILKNRLYEHHPSSSEKGLRDHRR